MLDDADRVGGKFASAVQSSVGISPTPVVVRGAPAQSKTSTESKTYGTEAPYLAGQGGTALGFTFLGGPLGITGMWIGLGADSGRVSWREIIAN